MPRPEDGGDVGALAVGAEDALAAEVEVLRVEPFTGADQTVPPGLPSQKSVVPSVVRLRALTVVQIREAPPGQPVLAQR